MAIMDVIRSYEKNEEITMPNVKLFANLRKIAGAKEMQVEGSSLAEVLTGLLDQYPALSAYLVENDQIRPHVVITLNGHPTLELQSPVTGADEIAIFPPIAGG